MDKGRLAPEDVHSELHREVAGVLDLRVASDQVTIIILRKSICKVFYRNIVWCRKFHLVFLIKTILAETVGWTRGTVKGL